jgi:hypothetical protein
VREGALREITLGETDAAIAHLQQGIIRCSDSDECSRTSLGRLYFALGIAFSSKSDRYDDAVRAFRRGLLDDPTRSLGEAWRTDDAELALLEAKKMSSSATSPSAPEAAPQASPASQASNTGTTEAKESSDEELLPPAEGTSLLLFSANASAGWGTQGRYDTTNTLAQVGPSVTWGFMPGQGRFTIGGRVRGIAMRASTYQS